MDSVCKKLTSGYDSFITTNCLHIENLNKYAKRYSLTIYLNDGQLRKSNKHGPEVFMVHKNELLCAHKNPGKLAKLPAGVNKLKGCIYNLSDIIKQRCDDLCDVNTDWKHIEEKFRVGINLWRKIGVGLNKTSIENLRRTKLEPAIHLHCDNVFSKVYLITCDKVYFRGHRHLIN